MCQIENGKVNELAIQPRGNNAHSPPPRQTLRGMSREMISKNLLEIQNISQSDNWNSISKPPKTEQVNYTIVNE